MPNHRHLAIAALSCVLVLVAGTSLRGYSYLGHRWPSGRVLYYVNPQSIHVSPAAAVSAVQAAAAVWNEQGDATVDLTYGGASSATSVGINYRNDVFFRNASNGAAVAETYLWWNSTGQLVDADIVFYEGPFRFFAASGCTTSGFYIENVGAHEFGHVLGIGHSEQSGVTMAPTVSSGCDRAQLSLEADDLQAVRTIYPSTVGGGGATAPTPPIAPAGLSAGADPDDPDSTVVLAWQDHSTNETGFRIEGSLDGHTFIPVGVVGANALSFRLPGLWPDATFYFRVSAYNAAGSSGYSNVAGGHTGRGPGSSAAVLSARGYRSFGLQKVDLVWSGLPGTAVDVYRNGHLLARVGNVGAGTDPLDEQEPGSYTYRICAAGTTTCTNESTVSF